MTVTPEKMKLSAPSKPLFLVSVVLAVVAILGGLGVVGAIAGYAFWIAIASFVVLAIGCLMTGM